MANVSQEVLTVERIGKFGFQSGGVWYGMSSKSGLTPSSFTPGSIVTVDVYTSDGGKKYVNKLVSVGGGVTASVAPVLTPKPTPPVDVNKLGEPRGPLPNYTNAADAKDRRIHLSGVIQAAVQAPVLQMFATNYEEWWALVEKTAINELEFVKRNS